MVPASWPIGRKTQYTADVTPDEAAALGIPTVKDLNTAATTQESLEVLGKANIVAAVSANAIIGVSYRVEGEKSIVANALDTLNALHSEGILPADFLLGVIPPVGEGLEAL